LIAQRYPDELREAGSMAPSQVLPLFPPLGSSLAATSLLAHRHCSTTYVRAQCAQDGHVWKTMGD
jgi:hypothetical protein